MEQAPELDSSLVREVLAGNQASFQLLVEWSGSLEQATR